MTDQTQNAQSSEFVHRIFSSIAGRYDAANHILSGGMDYLWRRTTARVVRNWNPDSIMDLATGSGDLALTLSRYNPKASIVGADFCFPMLEQAQKKKLSTLVVADGMLLPFKDCTFDVVTIAFGLRNMKDWPKAIRECARVLRHSGHLAVLDFSIPNGFFRTPYRFYLHHILPSLAGWVTREQSAYEYLGASIESFPQGNAMCELLEKNGFTSTASRPLTLGVVTLYTACKA